MKYENPPKKLLESDDTQAPITPFVALALILAQKLKAWENAVHLHSYFQWGIHRLINPKL